MSDVNVMTNGCFQSEELAMEAFDLIVESNGAFRLHKEVCGEYLQPRADTEKKEARIDRLMIPLKEAISAGWKMGAIGVEGKRSGSKIGKVVSQALDYSRCAWTLTDGVPGLLLLVRWVFVYPSDFPVGDIGSVMAQHRIGCVTLCGDSLYFNCGGTNGLILSAGGSVQIKPLPMGKKAGSR